MTWHPKISVVTPVHSDSHKLNAIRQVTSRASTPVELILVINNPELEGRISPEGPHESVIFCSRPGRGYAFLAGIAEAAGDIVLLLHSDTALPTDWDSAILRVMQDTKTVGGAFSISFDEPSPLLRIISTLSNLWSWLSKLFYGDRGIFVRSSVLEKCLPVLDVPLFEDIRLVRYLSEFGRLVLLKEEVKTSCEKYRIHGIMGYLSKIWRMQILYEMGTSPSQLYRLYYSER